MPAPEQPIPSRSGPAPRAAPVSAPGNLRACSPQRNRAESQPRRHVHHRTSCGAWPITACTLALLLALMAAPASAWATPAAEVRLPAAQGATESRRDPMTKERLARLTAQAEAGDPSAQLRLGMLLFGGDDPLVPKDLTQAARWLELATRGNDPFPHHVLGMLYYLGTGVPQDMDKGRQHLDKAVAGGVILSAQFMAEMLLTPFMPGYDPAEAARWLEKGALLGDARCIYNLGALHETGLGAPQDLRRAENLYRQAVAKGYTNAMNQLAALIDSGRASTNDPGEAARLFRKAAEKNHALAAYNLGIMLREGRGTRKDWAQAAYWFACADALGEKRAMKDLPPLLRQLSPAQRKAFNERMLQRPLPQRAAPSDGQP